MRAAQAAGLDASVDLIYGAPGESLDDWRTSVRSALDLGVRHLSAYALTVEPTTAMGRRIAAGTLPKPDDDEAAKYEIVDAMAQAAGLEWYEISNWAAPGHESRHNLGYWRNVDWAGIGPGAHSHYRLPAGGDDGGGGRAVRAWDTLHPRRWGQQINEGQVPFADHESIDPQADLEETIMLGLRLREGLDVQAVQARTGTDLAPVVHALTGDGLVTCTQGRIIPTLRGRLLNDTVIQRVFSAVLH